MKSELGDYVTEGEFQSFSMRVMRDSFWVFWGWTVQNYMLRQVLDDNVKFGGNNRSDVTMMSSGWTRHASNSPNSIYFKEMLPFSAPSSTIPSVLWRLGAVSGRDEEPFCLPPKQNITCTYQTGAELGTLCLHKPSRVNSESGWEGSGAASPQNISWCVFGRIMLQLFKALFLYEQLGC